MERMHAALTYGQQIRNVEIHLSNIPQDPNDYPTLFDFDYEMQLAERLQRYVAFLKTFRSDDRLHEKHEFPKFEEEKKIENDQLINTCRVIVDLIQKHENGIYILISPENDPICLLTELIDRFKAEDDKKKSMFLLTL